MVLAVTDPVKIKLTPLREFEPLVLVVTVSAVGSIVGRTETAAEVLVFQFVSPLYTAVK